MGAESITPVLPAPNLEAAVAFWRLVLGVEPTFVDGDRWAQFDLGPRRLALAGSDRVSDEPSLMIKVDDAHAARRQLSDHGHSVGEVETGPHELRFVFRSPFGTIVFYSPPSDSAFRA